MNKKFRVGWLLLGLLAFGIAIATSVVFVPAGNVAVITRWGAINRVMEPGVGFRIPIAEGLHIMNVRTQKDEVPATSFSSNLQTISAVIAVNYHLDGKYATQVYNEIGTKYNEIIVAPAIQNVFKYVTSKYTAENLVKLREEVRLTAEQELQKQLEPYHIIVENFNIVNFDFSAEYNAAIEAKQIAEQEVQTARQQLEKARVIAEKQVVEAKAQADAQAELKKSGSLTPEYLQYLFLTKWDGRLPSVMGGAMSTFDVMDFVGQTE